MNAQTSTSPPDLRPWWRWRTIQASIVAAILALPGAVGQLLPILPPKWQQTANSIAVLATVAAMIYNRIATAVAQATAATAQQTAETAQATTAVGQAPGG